MLGLVDDFKLLALFLVERMGWSSRADFKNRLTSALTYLPTKQKAQSQDRAKCLISLVGREGLEPATKGL